MQKKYHARPKKQEFLYMIKPLIMSLLWWWETFEWGLDITMNQAYESIRIKFKLAQYISHKIYNLPIPWFPHCNCKNILWMCGTHKWRLLWYTYFLLRTLSKHDFGCDKNESVDGGVSPLSEELWTHLRCGEKKQTWHLRRSADIARIKQLPRRSAIFAFPNLVLLNRIGRASWFPGLKTGHCSVCLHVLSRYEGSCSVLRHHGQSTLANTSSALA